MNWKNYQAKPSILVLFLLVTISLFSAKESYGLVTNATVITDSISCSGASDGMAYVDGTSITSTNPGATFTFFWTGGNLGGTVIADTIKNLVSANYVVRIRDNIDGTLSPPFFFTIFGPNPLIPFLLSNDESCFNACDGDVEAFEFGGTGPFTYLWDDPLNSTTKKISNLCDGTYRVTITDSQGCTAIDSATVNGNPQIQPALSKVDVACFGDATGSVTSNTSGGTGGNYTFNWSNGVSGAGVNVINGLVANTYTVTVTDGDGCTNTESIVVNQPAAALTGSINGSDALCFGDSSGSIVGTVSGGTPGYTFTWSDGGPNSINRANLPANTYSVTVSDNNGCTISLSEVIGQPTDIATVFNTGDVSCNGGSDGTATVTASNGAPGSKTFDWSNGSPQTTDNSIPYQATINGLSAGKYFVTVTNINGCTKVDSVEIFEPTAIAISFDVETPPSCNGGSDGSIFASATGGTPALTFNWSTGASSTGPTSNITGLSSGSYTVTVIDANNCTSTLSTTLTDPAPIVPNLSPSDALCKNECTGSITAAPTGGNSPYFYVWSSGGTAATESNLCAGTYTVTIIDNGGCSIVSSATVGEPALVLSSNLTKSDAFCAGTATGSISNTVTGGTPNYSFLWNDGATTQNRGNITAGTYTVTVTDANLCTTSSSITVGEVQDFVLSFAGTDVSCNGGLDGSITVTKTLGTPGSTTFNWSTGATNTDNTVPYESTINNLAAGTYRVTVTNVLGCTKVDSATINEPSPLALVIDNQTDPLCNGSSDGTINITGSGGTPNYNFLWNDNSTNEDRTGLAAGTYTVTLTDANLCTISISTTLSNPATLTVSIDSTRDATCQGNSDGFARALGAGGTPGYNYAWNNGVNNRANPNLAAGTYTVTVTDANLCTATTTVTVGAPQALVASIAKTDASCAGVNDGTATANETGGTGPYNYQWGPPGNQTTKSITGLAGGSYFVTITDAQGCTDSASVNILQPAAIALSLAKTDLLCFNDSSGTATVTASGGTTPYTYSWSPNTSTTTATATGLKAITYFVTVSDFNGCSKDTSITLTEPPLLTVNITNPVNPTCNGINDGSANANAAGGTVAGNYSFLWSPDGETTANISNKAAGTYTVVVTDDNGCTAEDQVTLTSPASVVISLDSIADVSCNGGNDGLIITSGSGGTAPLTFIWSNAIGNTGSNINLSAGSYTLTLSDNNGCFTTQSFTINEPATALSANTVTTDILCNGDDDGTATITVSGGTPGYNFAWPGGLTGNSNNNLDGGNYDVTITDANGCILIESFVINEPNPLVASISKTDVTCNGANDGTATASATGGTPGYVFTWAPPLTGNPVTGLAPGTYAVTVTDANNCTDSASVTITQGNALGFTVINEQNISCNGANDGVIEVTGTGGTPGYNYAWSAGGSTTGLNNNLSPGPYSVTITDNAGCSVVYSTTISEPTLLTVSINTDKVPCSGVNDGALTANENGGTPPYAYAWTGTAQTTKSVTGLGTGIYSVTVTDANNCTASANTPLSFTPPIVVIGATATDATCFSASDGAAVALAGGGSGTLTFTWSNGFVGNINTGLAAGTYTVTINDNNSCIETRTVVVGRPSQLVPNLVTTDESCGGSGNGDATVTPSGATPPYTYTWSTGATGNGASSTINNLSAGNYSLTISDDNSCDSVFNFTINPGNVSYTFTDSVVQASCNGNCDGFIEIKNLTGGVAPISYTWNDGTLGPIRSNLCVGSYTVTIADANGCDSVQTYNINQPSNLTFTINTIDDTCIQSKGSANIPSVSGGTPPYTFIWSGGTGVNNTVTGLLTGKHWVTVTDGICSVVDTFQIGNTATFTIDSIITDVSCHGFNDGSIVISVIGGVNPVTYTWNKGLVGPNPGNLAAGVYDLTVQDFAGCRELTSITVGQPDSLIVNLSSTPESCVPGNDGVATANVTGGTTPYTFTWSGGTPVGNTTTGLSDGVYDLTLTDFNGCQVIDDIRVFSSSPYSVVDSIVDASCNGGTDGEIILTVSGATPPVSFIWSNGQTGSSLSNLAAGAYGVTITDGTTCSRTASYTVAEDAPITLDITTYDESCSPGGDGAAKVIPTGGVTPYTYAWSGGTSLGDSVINLTAGGYTVTVADSNGCEKVKAFTIRTGSDIDANDSITNLACFGDSDGEIFLNPSGGDGGPYSYAWFDGSVNKDRFGLSSGTYTVTISDNATPPCTKVEILTVNSPDAVASPGVFVFNEYCNPPGNGAVFFFPQGGTPPYTIQSAVGTVVGTKIDLLSAGTYTATITDSRGCTGTRSYTINTRVPPSLTSAVTPATCNGGNDGTITITTAGGTNPMTFDWTGNLAGANPSNVSAGTYTVTVTDGAGCTSTETVTVGEGSQITATFNTTGESCNPGNDGAVTATPSGGAGGSPYTYDWGAGNTTSNSNTGLNAGNYNVTITDAIGCTEVIPYIINSDAPFTLSSQVFDVSCFGFADGAINLTVTGNSGSITYNWSGGLPSLPGQLALSGGTYSVTVTDAGTGCTETDQFTINEPDSITINSTVTPESCTPGNDGSITLNPTGGTTATPGLYTYAWSGGLPATSSQNNLSAGTYTVTVTDDNSCTNSLQIVISPTTPISVSLNPIDIVCNGGNDGQIVLTTSAVNPTFNWSNGASTKDISNLSQGSYTVTVTEPSSGCTATASANINEPSVITASATTTLASCIPGNDGTATASASGGTVASPGAYTFNWSTGASGANQTGLAAGNYDVTVIDDVGCRVTIPVTINSQTTFTVSLDSTDIDCNGASTGAITLTSTAINPTYLWSTGAITQNVSGLIAGTYTVTVTEPSSGCTASASSSINEPSLIVPTVIAIDASCIPGNDGSATVSAVGGTVATAGAYTFNWSTGASGTSINNLSSGNYDVTVIDDNGCTVVENFVINSVANFNFSLDSTDISCNGLIDGAITLTTGAVNPTFNWNSGATTQNLSNLSAGVYTVTVTEPGTGCTAVDSIRVNEPNLIVPSLLTTDESCIPGGDGTALASATGGTVATPGAYTFNWSTGATGISINSLSAGNYDVTVIDDNACSVVEPFTIGSSVPFQVFLDSIPVNCNGGNDGGINLTTTATNPTFTWSNGLPPTQNQTGLAAGIYRVTVTEPGAGCSKVDSIEVTEPALLIVNTSTTNASCSPGNDGTATALPIGGTAAIDYSYAWSNGALTATASNLSPGSYSVTVTDDNGCTAVGTANISGPTSILPNESFSNESCANACDGGIVLNPTGGDGNYSYAWNTGETTRTRTNLCAGTYTVTITDGGSCDTTISITINAANSLSASISTQNLTCNTSAVCDGSAFATVSGGTSPYQFDWGAGISIGLGPDTAINLCIGNYSVTITDANSCTLVENFSITGPAAITASFNPTNPTCNICNGSLTVVPAGGSGNFTFEWYDASLNPLNNQTNTINSLCAAIYFVDVTDDSGCSQRFSFGLSDNGAETISVSTIDANCANSCDGSATVNFTCSDPACSIAWFNASTGAAIAGTTNTISGLCAGNYFVEVTNNSACKSFENFTINEPASFIVSASISDVSCFNGFDGSISVTASGGNGTLTYNWAPGPIAGQGTATVSSLQAGAYSLTVSDANGCDTVLSYTVNQATEIQASFTSVPSNCGASDGIINAVVSGGTVAVDYTYEWLDGASNPIAGGINPTINGLSAGNYFLHVTDDNGCEKTFLTNLGNTNAPQIVIDSIRNSTCFGANDAAIFANATGTNTPFSFNWLPGGQTGNIISNISAGTYTLVVTNSLGCQAFDTIQVNGPTEITATLTKTEANCGACDGTAQVAVSGGTAPYTYLWSNGSVADTAAGLCGGTHTAVISDANGCQKIVDFSINTNGGPTGETVTITAASCASSCDGSATVSPIGGTAPYTYQWLHNGATTNSLNNLCPGNYTLQVSDVKGCSRTVDITIASPAAMSLQSTVTAHNCSAIPCDGSIRVDVNGGTKPYSYAWTPNVLPNSNVQNGLCAGIYNVTVTDIAGCSLVETIIVPNSGVNVSANPAITDVTCFGSCDGSLVSNVVSVGTVEYQWLNDQGQAVAPLNTDLLNAACAGDYVLEITTLPQGCKNFYTVTVTEPDSIVLGASIVKNISCAGECDGEIFINTRGGNILYQYSWNDPNNQDGIPAVNLCAGTYGVTATDANGCSATTSVTLVDPPVLSLTINSSGNVSCSSDCDASASVSGSGGTAPYTFNWDGGQSGSNPNTLCYGPNIVTMSDATGCSVTDTVFISATDTVDAIVPTKLVYCDGDSIKLSGQVLGSSVTSSGWYTNNGTALFTTNIDTSIFLAVGNYSFQLIASNGSCNDTAVYNFSVENNPNIGLASSVSIFKDEVVSIRLTGALTRYTYLWTPGRFLSDSTIPEPNAAPTESITYTLLVTDTNNCTFLDSIKVIYQKDLDIPSGISPNGDGVNDVWEIDFLEEFPEANVFIYNRWGELIYEQKNGYKVSWDGTYQGKALPIGTYYYIIDLKSPRFEPFTGPITIVK